MRIDGVNNLVQSSGIDKPVSSDKAKSKEVPTQTEEKQEQRVISHTESTSKKAEMSLMGQAKEAAIRSQMDGSLNASVNAGGEPVKTGGNEEDSKFVDDKLSYKVTDWAVTDKDVKQVHDKLETLPPEQYKTQMDDMKKSGKLGRYVDNMDNDQKKAFLDQAQRKGYVKAQELKSPEGPLNPPKGPKLYANDPNLPKEMREVIHEQNRDSAKNYEKEYQNYADRYCEEVKKCKTGEDVRKLGKPAGPADTRTQPGIDNPNDEFAKKWADENLHESNLPLSQKQIRNDVARKMEDITKRKHPGDVSVDVEFSTPGGNKFKVGYGSESGFDAEAGKEKKAGAAKGSVDSGGNAEVGVDVGVGEVSGKSDGTVEVKTKVHPQVKGVSSLNPKEREMRTGVEVGDEKTGSAKGTVGVRGITPEETYEAIAPGPGYYNDPPELQQGKKWDEISPENKKRYKDYYGWTPAEWDNKVEKQKKS